MTVRIEDPYEARAWRDYERWVIDGPPTGEEEGAVERTLQVAGDAAASVGGRMWASVRATRGVQALKGLTSSAGRLAGSAAAQRTLDEVAAAVEGAYGTAVEAALQTVDPTEVLQHYRGAGHVPHLEDLRDLPLRVLDRHRPPVQTRFVAQFAAAGGATGVAQGAASVTGIVAGGVLVGDVVSTVALSARAIATTLAHYGYDVTGPREHAYVLTVLQAATADTAAERQGLAEQAIDLDRRRLLGELDDNLLTSMAHAAFSASVKRMVRGRLARFLPGVSGAIGVAAGYRHGRLVLQTADHAGRARLLRDRWGVASIGP